jgi:hypothetical protein
LLLGPGEALFEILDHCWLSLRRRLLDLVGIRTCPPPPIDHTQLGIFERVAHAAILWRLAGVARVSFKAEPRQDVGRFHGAGETATLAICVRES